jgi:hypothetical protein
MSVKRTLKSTKLNDTCNDTVTGELCTDVHEHSLKDSKDTGKPSTGPLKKLK